MRLLQLGIIKPQDLLRKYQHELHSNEIVLLAYYIAAINIEETFHTIQREAAEKTDYKGPKHDASAYLKLHAAHLLEWNPCPCGYYGDPKRECRCSPRQIENYRQRISGPLLDRIDIHVEVPLVDFRELSSTAPGEKSAAIRQRMPCASAAEMLRAVRRQTPAVPDGRV